MRRDDECLPYAEHPGGAVTTTCLRGTYGCPVVHPTDCPYCAPDERCALHQAPWIQWSGPVTITEDGGFEPDMYEALKALVTLGPGEYRVTIREGHGCEVTEADITDGVLKLETVAASADPEPEREYIVLHAPGWPGGIQPHPNTLECCREFVAEHGGVLKWRWTCEWQEVLDG